MTNRHEISTAAHPSNDARTGAERSDKTGKFIHINLFTQGIDKEDEKLLKY